MIGINRLLALFVLLLFNGCFNHDPIEDNVINNNMTYPTFTHMKTKLQDWPSGWSESWTKHIHTDFNNNCQLKVGNYVQKLPFHYHDKDFLTDKIIAKLERKLGI